MCKHYFDNKSQNICWISGTLNKTHDFNDSIVVFLLIALFIYLGDLWTCWFFVIHDDIDASI